MFTGSSDELINLVEDQKLTVIVAKICMSLYALGIEYVHVGGLLRIVGAPAIDAEKYDEEVLTLDETFYEGVKDLLDFVDEAEVDDKDIVESVDGETGKPPLIH